MTAHTITDIEQDGLRAVRLTSPAGMAVDYVPSAGMVCCSLIHRGEQLLGQRDGLRAYAERGSTMGIPLLHPWANRLRRMGYRFENVSIDLPAGSPFVHDDGKGLPIHGLLAGCPDWAVLRRENDAESARLEAQLDIGAGGGIGELFPFPHEIGISASLSGTTLTITTTLRPTGDTPVPVAFGYHPYFQLPGLDRKDWNITLPVRRRMRLDRRKLPTGKTEAVAIRPGPLRKRTYDDLFDELDPEPVFRMSGGGREITVSFGSGYRYAVVYAPGNDDVVCFEPMTAPTDPFEGDIPPTIIKPGDSFSATFTIAVT